MNEKLLYYIAGLIIGGLVILICKLVIRRNKLL
jgi:hypothetical protein